MTEGTGKDAVQLDERVDARPDEAFKGFVDQFGEWWPSVFTFSADELDVIGIEPKVGGRCFERDRAGNEFSWGEVLIVDRPRRIVFSWWITPDRTIDDDPERASEIEVRFMEGHDGKTQVTLEHRKISHHAGDWQMMRDAMAEQHGWPWLMQLYSGYLQGS